jgi:peptidoglycan/xylan/chitin deacetylase (PgdA/CDA1 family)
MCAGVFVLISCAAQHRSSGETEITKWQFGKRGAVSITYDDGTINQFRKALPIMNNLKIPATFFINTGQISGSQYMGAFIGRPVKTIIEETATIPTNTDNFFERSSAAGFLGLNGTLEYHIKAGEQFDEGSPEKAYKIIDELYEKVRLGYFTSSGSAEDGFHETDITTWDEIRIYAAQGHEFASHMVSHPYLAALDEVNILYELEKSREEIFNQLGLKYTFSAEVPFGTENERALEYARKVYPALRNRMPELYLKELNRGNSENPRSAEMEYVQWQRGATTKTSLTLMKSWIDTTSVNDNIWLVLVLHGVDGIGWEALDINILEEYFRYMKSNENNLWIATFGDVTRYMRERMGSIIKTGRKGRKITVNIINTLDPTMYSIPLTLKTYVPSKWKKVQVKEGSEKRIICPQYDMMGSYILYQVIPNAGETEVTRK